MSPAMHEFFLERLVASLDAMPDDALPFAFISVTKEEGGYRPQFFNLLNLDRDELQIFGAMLVAIGQQFLEKKPPNELTTLKPKTIYGNKN